MLSPLPRVISFSAIPELPEVTASKATCVDGVRQQVAHLHAQGRRKIVQIVESWKPNTNGNARSIYRHAQRIGPPARGDEICVATRDWMAESDEKWPELMDDLIRERRADAVLADNDYGASALARTAQRMGIRVPQDLAIMGWGESQFASFANPRFTTVNFQLKEIANAALDTCCALMKNPKKTNPSALQ